MERMLRALDDSICGVVYKNGDARNFSLNKKIFSLREERNFISRIISRRSGMRGEEIALHKIISKTAPNLIFINYLSFARKFERVLRDHNIPVICHTHGADITCDIRSHEQPECRAYDDKYVDFIRSVGSKWTIIANSKYSERLLLDAGISEKNIRVKYFGVSVAESLILPKQESQDGVKILYLGRLVDCKGPDLTIKAFNILCDNGVDAILTIAGDGPLRVTCELEKSRSKYKDRINIVGKVDKIKGDRLRREHHIFTAHSQFGPLTRQEESFGVAFLEGMAAGMPVVTGRSGGIPEFVEHGKTGFLFEPGDVQAHADYLLRLVKNGSEREAMGVSALEAVRAKFGPEQEGQRLREIISLS